MGGIIRCISVVGAFEARRSTDRHLLFAPRHDFFSLDAGALIDKGGGKRRPLGLPTVEDKLVQMAARRVLEAIYEKDFLECNNGYRPGRGARQTTLKLQDRLFLGRVRWMVDGGG